MRLSAFHRVFTYGDFIITAGFFRGLVYVTLMVDTRVANDTVMVKKFLYLF